MKITLSTWISLAIMAMTLNSVQAFMTPPSSRSYNPSFSRDRVVIYAGGDIIIIGPGGQAASSPEEDLELTIRIISHPSSAVIPRGDTIVSEATNTGEKDKGKDKPSGDPPQKPQKLLPNEPSP